MRRDSLVYILLLVIFSFCLACSKVDNSIDNNKVALPPDVSDKLLSSNGVADYSYLAKILAAYVSDSGLVNYGQLKENRSELDRFIGQLAKVTSEDLEAMASNEQIAFWINAYNAITLQSIINHYPISAGFIKGLAFPKNSIRQIDGVWDKAKHTVAGRQLTLDAIEHQILRAKFKEPRVHLALVCAAISCPPLRNEPYLSQELDRQFARQAKAFLASKQGMQIGENVRVSKIFKWFADDFLWLYPESKNSSLAVRKYLAQYAPSLAAERLLDEKEPLDYLDYNWTLNEQ